ncbi:hydroxyacylglutathione hydrolase [Nematocida sp. AWRm77]|nr:hydroxyacylglutathione hydrolase [Nematocida sp. AWRm77]
MIVEYLRVSGRTNLMYVVLGSEGTVLLVDPYEPEKIKECLAKKNVHPKRVIALTTHGHEDHNGGNSFLEDMFPGIVIYAGSTRSYTHKVCADKDVLEYPDVSITCLHIPCHTLDSFAYLVESRKPTSPKRGVFVGDTVFYLGCGKFFEGTAEMMHACFEKIMSCPEDTVVYTGHDYKEANLAFRESVLGEPVDKDLAKSFFLTVRQEKAHNLFINTALLDRLSEFSSLSSIDRLSLLRYKKDNWTYE